MFEKCENNFLIAYSYKGTITTTIYFYNEKCDIFDISNVINDLIIRNMPFIEMAIKGLIIRFNSATTPELGLNPKKTSEHIKMCCDNNKIFIDENEKNISISFRDITITYKLDGYHKNE